MIKIPRRPDRAKVKVKGQGIENSFNIGGLILNTGIPNNSHDLRVRNLTSSMDNTVDVDIQNFYLKNLSII